MHDRLRHSGNASAAFAALAIAAPLALFVVPASGQGQQAMPVRVAAVRQQPLQDMRQVTGELRAVARSQVATIEPGLVLELPVDEGQAVKAGDVLAVLDSRRLALGSQHLEARKRVAEATLAARAAEKSLKSSDLKALRDLEGRGASMPKEMADAEAQVAVAEALELEAERNIESIQAELDLLKTRLEDMTITAPFDGVVTEMITERAQWVGEGDAIVEILAIDRYDAWLDVPQAMAGAVIGGSAMVQVQIEPGGLSFPPAEARVVPLVDRTARNFPIFIRLEDPERRLAAGMAVVGWVPTGKEAEYLTVPRDSLMRNDAGFYVYVARQQGEGAAVAAPAQVQVLFTTGDRAAVRSGALKDGDLVVVEGNERLFPMMPIAFDAPSSDGAGKGSAASRVLEDAAARQHAER